MKYIDRILSLFIKEDKCKDCKTKESCKFMKSVTGETMCGYEKKCKEMDWSQLEEEYKIFDSNGGK